MRLTRFALLLAGAMAVGACDEAGTDPILAPDLPMAYTRFINGVADTGATDWSFIDRIDYSPKMVGMTFRSFSPYQQTFPGSRQIRIFPSSTDIAVTQQHLIDATITLEAGKYYTLIHTGYARAGSTPADQLIVMEDPHPATVAATNFATRFVHLGTGLGAQDAFAVATATTTIVGATPMFTNIAYLAASTYNSAVPTGPLAFRAANTGTTTVTASALMPAGAAADATNNLTAIAGTSQGGSVFTGYLFPRSVAGSSAPQTTAFQSPAIIYLYDRHPR
jgi:hypothetical protein